MRSHTRTYVASIGKIAVAALILTPLVLLADGSPPTCNEQYPDDEPPYCTKSANGSFIRCEDIGEELCPDWWDMSCFATTGEYPSRPPRFCEGSGNTDKHCHTHDTAVTPCYRVPSLWCAQNTGFSRLVLVNLTGVR
jgi:hypothetical protein